MNQSDFSWNGGSICFWSLSELDTSIPLTKQSHFLREDLALISYKNNCFIDIGWYPSFDPGGSFKILAIVNDEWERPLREISASSYQELRRAINDCIMCMQEEL